MLLWLITSLTVKILPLAFISIMFLLLVRMTNNISAFWPATLSIVSLWLQKDHIADVEEVVFLEAAIVYYYFAKLHVSKEVEDGIAELEELLESVLS